MVAILAGLSFVLFGLLSAMPGDPVDLLITSNPSVKPEDVVRLKKLRGLDKPWTVRYLRWLWGHHAPLPSPRIRNIDDVAVDLVWLDASRPQDGYKQQEAFVDLQAALDAAGFDAMWSIRPLHDAKIDESSPGSIKLGGDVSEPGQHRFWAEVKNRHGLMAVIAVDIWAAPPVPFLEGDHDVKPRTEAERLAAAKVPPARRVVEAVPTRVIDDPNEFAVDLSALVVAGDAAPSFTLGPGSPGRIEASTYRLGARDEGQDLVAFVSSRGERGAFVVEHGPLPDPERFERGFLFALIG